MNIILQNTHACMLSINSKFIHVLSLMYLVKFNKYL